ncbi:MAG: hypothetical protein PHC61_04235 [Chitinivibrionales bacterium]|nr:hypothetical protein [Chitinivibrionales bacterium]
MPKIHSIEFFASKCIVELTVNGLFIFRSDAKNGVSLNYPFNTELIGKGNSVTFTLYPTILDNGLPSSYSDVTIQGTIKIYGENDITGPETGELIQRIDFTDVIEQRKMDAVTITDLTKLFHMTKTFTFDNDGLSFRNRLLDAPVIKDEKLLLDYAEKLRDILAKQDIEALWREYKPKVDDYANAYPQEFPDSLQWFTDFFKNDFFPGGPVTDFKKDDIGLRSWCDGRVWEIFVKPAQKFFLNKGLDGDINSIEIFVSLVDGKIKIVR